MASGATFQLVAVVTYLVGMLLVGWWASRATANSADEYLVAGRRFPLWMVTATLFATWWCGGTAMGSAGAVYEEGIMGVIPDPFAAGACLIIAGLFYMRILRRMKLRSMGVAYTNRYGRSVGVVASIIMVYVYILYLAVQFMGVGKVFSTILGLPYELTSVVGALVLIAYTYLGGIVAVAWTDFFQMLLILLGLIAIMPMAISKAGGWNAVIRSPSDTSWWYFFPHTTSFEAWMVYLAAWLGMGLGCITEPELLQRAFIAKDERTAVNASLITGGMYLSLGWIPILLGFAGIALVNQGVIPADALAEDSEVLVPLIAKTLLSPLPLAIFLSSLLAGLMSTGDSVLFSNAVIVSNDLYRAVKKKWLGTDLSEKELFVATKIAILALGALSLIVGLSMESLYDLMVYSYSLLFCMLFMPFTAGLYWKKANAPGAMAGMLGGLAVIVYGMITCRSIVPEPEWAYILISPLVSLVSMIVVTVATQKSHPPRPLLSEYNEIVKWPELVTPEMDAKPYVVE